MAAVPDTINFSDEEAKILQFWLENKCFENCLKQSKSKPRYTFYDGPPFATGLPHYGHILAGTIKDIVTRYAHQQGYHVDRRFGWDCHGLPIEFEIDKLFGIKTPEDIESKMGGIENYNNECRKIVMRYSKEWREVIGRMGRWIDFDNDYKTLYPWYMESIWWVFKQLFVKGLVYRGVKVMPYSTACTTPLSNFESGQNYKEVVDPSVIVSFPLKNTDGNVENVSILAWTTTPWTLPSNLALCVNPKLMYCEVLEKKSGQNYIVMECRLEFCFGKGFMDMITVQRRFLGEELEGRHYEPIFDYFYSQNQNRAFRILTDNYVSDENGTGIVHQAPFFGEDDYRVCLKHQVIAKEDNFCPVDDCGRFVAPVTDYLGIYVKDADKMIIKSLKEKGRLLSSGQMKHSYPFCWRSDTPLIYKAVPSWFIRVEHFQQKLTNCSGQTYWVPEFVKEKRFGNWLREARDWAISRNRYWGTPIPIWTSADFQEIIVIGSIEELKDLSGVTDIKDLHRENIDKITIPSRNPNHPPLKRICEVFDCWFESGSMPYAQQHYPFENKQEFMNMFPADFIAEGIDQTRGWFYTILVISTLLFNKPPFKNLIANGLVLASDGQKMSKRKKNYPDPMVIVNSYGADALRLYLINSPVVRAENLKFKEEGVRDVIKDVFLPWYNAFRFFYQNVDRLREVDQMEFKVNLQFVPTNVMDTWITSFKESLLDFIGCEMKAYRLYTVVPRLTKFIDQLTNWYVRLNRRRIKGEFGTEDCVDSLNTLYDILMTMTKMMAPFTPFLTEFMYQRLDRFVSDNTRETGVARSVHYEMMPKVNPVRIDKKIERQVANVQRVIELGRILRDRKTIPIKYPLSQMIILMTSCDEQAVRDEFDGLEVFIKNELNVREVIYTNDKSRFGVRMAAEPDHKVLGTKFKADYKRITDLVKAMTDGDIERVQMDGVLNLQLAPDHTVSISVDELRFLIKMDDDPKKSERDLIGAADKDLLVLLNVQQDANLIEEGLAREVINRVQKLKKKLNLVQTDLVFVGYNLVLGTDAVLKKHKSFIEGAIKSEFADENHLMANQGKARHLGKMASEEVHLNSVNLKFMLTIYREVQRINRPFINLLFLAPNSIQCSSIINENLSLNQLQAELKNMFRIGQRKRIMFMDKTKTAVTDDGKIQSGQTHFLYAFLEENGKVVDESKQLWDNVASLGPPLEDQPYCKFVNFEANNNPQSMFVENPKGTLVMNLNDSESILCATFKAAKINNVQFSL